MRARRSDPLNDELTALDELEDEIRRPKKRSWSLIVPLLITMIVMTGGVTIAWYSYTAGIKEGSEGAAPLLKPKGPMKVAPANPGGLAIPHQDKTVFNSIDGRGKEKGVERLLPPPEKPMQYVFPASRYGERVVTSSFLLSICISIHGIILVV